MKKGNGIVWISPLFKALVIIFFTGIACKHPKSTLKETFKDMFLVGATIDFNQVAGIDTNVIKLTRQQFNSITSENNMKWGEIHPQLTTYNFAAADSFVNFGERNGMFIIGQCLLMSQQTPEWVFRGTDGNLVNRDTLLKRLHNHISTIVGRYKGRVDGWDVVNDAIADTGGIRNSKWFEILGEEYIEKAFEYAHEADPSAELYYSDYSLSDKVKRDEAVRLVRELESKGVKIDGIGMQGHFTLDSPQVNAFDSSIIVFSDLGVNIMINELDVTVLPLPTIQRNADASGNYQYQENLDTYINGIPDSVQLALAKRYYDLFKILVKHGNVITRVTFWGVNDGQSFRNNWPIKGRKDYPLLFDRNNQPKPAFDAVIHCAGDKVGKE